MLLAIRQFAYRFINISDLDKKKTTTGNPDTQG